MGNYIFVFIFTMLVVCIIFCIIALIKNDNTYLNRIIIIEAICEYNISLITSGQNKYTPISYNDMEPRECTYKRWWDWGYENILPSDKFEIIKPYIKNNR